MNTEEDIALNAERQLFWQHKCMGHNLSANTSLYVQRADSNILNSVNNFSLRLHTKIAMKKDQTVTAFGGYLVAVAPGKKTLLLSLQHKNSLKIQHCQQSFNWLIFLLLYCYCHMTLCVQISHSSFDSQWHAAASD